MTEEVKFYIVNGTKISEEEFLALQNRITESNDTALVKIQDSDNSYKTRLKG